MSEPTETAPGPSVNADHTVSPGAKHGIEPATGGVLIAKVMVESSLPQLDRLFDYSVPASLRGEAVPGVRVKVPLRSAGRIARGYIVELTSELSFGGELSEIDDVVSDVPVLTPEVWALARRVADRNAGSASDVVRLAVPPRQVRVEKAWKASRPAPGSGDALPAPVPITGYGSGTIEHGLGEHHRLAVTAIPVVAEVAPGQWTGSWAVTMAQSALFALSRGESSILVVPDYRDQEQLVLALEAIVPPEAITPLDARQTNPERYRHFLSCLEDRPRVIIGNRSAVYAPAHNLGLIALWDDADPLHREPLSPYAGSRDVALVRQQLSGCALMFVSHARSTEVQRLVQIGFVSEVEQNPRILPKVVPTADQASSDRFAQSARIPSSAWLAVKKALETGPVLVQVARPGYAPVVACTSCKTPARCRTCEGPLRLTHQGATPSCGWCGAIAAQWACRHCEGTSLRMVTIGTGRTAEELGRAFPGTRVIISDGERVVTEVGNRPALVVATRGAEPVAAGGYHAVLLLDGDRMLSREALTVAEDCLRWWSNAVALAAPKAPSILVGVGSALARAMVTWRQDAFSAEELEDRRHLRFPPAVRVVSVRGNGAVVDRALATLHDSVGEQNSARLDVLGPVDDTDGLVRAVVRFDYALGADVAKSLRGSIIKNATGRTKRETSAASGTKTTFRPPPPLRVRFDDTEILE